MITNKQGFIFRRTSKKRRVVHVWTGSDTVCRMWSTGGMVHSKFDYVESPEGFTLCANCKEKLRRS